MISDRKKRVLILCPSMLPKMNFWGETQRMYYLANYLSEHDWEVYTFSPEFKGNQQEYLKKQKYTSIYRKYRDISRISLDSSARNEENRNVVCRIRKILSKIITPIVNWIYNEPDCFEAVLKQIWLWKYKKDICKLIEDNAIEVVIISVPTFVFLQMGKVIHEKFSNVAVIYDYRDPWHLWNKKKNLAYWREKRYLSYADYIVGVSDTFSRDMVQYFNIDSQKISTVWNGFSEEDWRSFEEHLTSSMRETNKKLRLVYTGNMMLSDDENNYRNPSKLIRAVNKMNRVELYLVGVKDNKANSVQGNIHYVGVVGQVEALKYMNMGDVLISIHDSKDASGKYIVSGKFYDYMRSGKVMWHIGNKNSLMTRMIHENSLGICCENNDDELENALKILLKLWENDELEQLRSCNVERLFYFSREHQYERYNAILCSKIK